MTLFSNSCFLLPSRAACLCNHGTLFRHREGVGRHGGTPRWNSGAASATRLEGSTGRRCHVGPEISRSPTKFLPSASRVHGHLQFEAVHKGDLVPFACVHADYGATARSYCLGSMSGRELERQAHFQWPHYFENVLKPTIPQPCLLLLGWCRARPAAQHR